MKDLREMTCVKRSSVRMEWKIRWKDEVGWLIDD